MVVWCMCVCVCQRETEQRGLSHSCASCVVLWCLLPENQGDPTMNLSSDCFNSDTPREAARRWPLWWRWQQALQFDPTLFLNLPGSLRKQAASFIVQKT